MSRPFTDGDVIAHFSNGQVNAIYTRMEKCWHRAPTCGSVKYDNDWETQLHHGLNGDEGSEFGYIFVGNVRHLAGQIQAL